MLQILGFDGKKNEMKVIFMELIHGQFFAKLSNEKQKMYRKKILCKKNILPFFKSNEINTLFYSLV